MQSYCNRWESLSAMCPMWEERQEFRKATRCSARARPRSAASLSSGVETESDSSDASGARRTVCKQSKEQGRENRAAGERGPGSLGAGQCLCGELRATRGGAGRMVRHTREAAGPLTLLFDGSSAAFRGALHNQLTCEGHEFLNAKKHNTYYLFLSPCPQNQGR